MNDATLATLITTIGAIIVAMIARQQFKSKQREATLNEISSAVNGKNNRPGAAGLDIFSHVLAIKEDQGKILERIENNHHIALNINSKLDELQHNQKSNTKRIDIIEKQLQHYQTTHL